MTDEAFLAGKNKSGSPTWVRHAVLFVLTLMSVLLYLDRFAVGIAAEYIREDLHMSQAQMSWFVSAFFWSYAICQVPAGWLSDRFGGWMMLTIYILAWSIVTGLMGVAHAVWLVLWLITPCGFGGQLGAFLLFRFFDAVKPGPVGWADQAFKGLGWRGGFGIMFDDTVAAFCTLLVIACWRF